MNVQNTFKDPFKIPIAEWVYKRVQSGIDVSQPYGEHMKVMAHTLSAESHDHKGYEVWDPTQQKSSNDET